MNSSPSTSSPKAVWSATTSRRDFVKRAVAASTAFAVPHVLTHPVFGVAAPSNRVNVGQLGCGGISNYHIGFLGGMPKPGDEQLPISPEHNRNFIDCVKSRQETICPVEMAIRCDTICQMADIAARTGRTIRWDPAKETIVGDAQASQMLIRPYRDHWKVW